MQSCGQKPDPVSVPISQLAGYQGVTKAPTTGPNTPVIETDPGLPEWTIYRPELFDEGPHPIVAWAQGGCLKNGTLYGQWLLELASFGYIVLSDGPPTQPSDDPAIAGTHQGAGGAPQIAAIEWLIAENDRPCSQYFNKVTLDKMAVAGQSCGGLMSLAAAADKRTTAVIGNSGGLFSAGSLHTPVIYLIGGETDSVARRRGAELPQAYFTRRCATAREWRDVPRVAREDVPFSVLDGHDRALDAALFDAGVAVFASGGLERSKLRFGHRSDFLRGRVGRTVAGDSEFGPNLCPFPVRTCPPPTETARYRRIAIEPRRGQRSRWRRQCRKVPC
jgi:dienelactone hydrolase